MRDIFLESVNILSQTTNVNENRELRNEIRVILEDSNSPVTTTYITKLYDNVVSKSHIDFGDIPNSKGDITKYKGYNDIKEIINIIKNLANENKAANVKKYADIIELAIARLEALSDVFELGFSKNNNYVMLDYNIYVYTVVQATSALLYEFVDYIKRPDSEIVDIVIKNTNRKPSLFYFNQLEKFINATSNSNYKDFLTTMISQGKENFIGVDTAIGLGAVMVVAISIVPITRELIYQFYNIKSKASDYLLQQAYFLELNKARLEASSEFDIRKKKDIIRKQENARKQLIRLSEKLRVEHVKSEYTKDKMISTDNSLLSLKHVNREIEERPLTLM